jgi:alpha-amylase
MGSEHIKSKEYLQLGRVTEFRYGRDLGRAFRRQFPLAYLRSFGRPEWGMLPPDHALVFVDNHDNQRGHGGGGSSILTFYDAAMYRAATVFALAHPYGFIRLMSSHRWDGGPHRLKTFQKLLIDICGYEIFA